MDLFWNNPILNNIVEPELGGTILFNIVDNCEQCGQQSIVQSCFHQYCINLSVFTPVIDHGSRPMKVLEFLTLLYKMLIIIIYSFGICMCIICICLYSIVYGTL